MNRKKCICKVLNLQVMIESFAPNNGTQKPKYGITIQVVEQKQKASRTRSVDSYQDESSSWISREVEMEYEYQTSWLFLQ